MGAPLPSSPPSRRIHYAWAIVALTFVVTLVGAGIRTAPPVLIHPLEAEFGWSRSAISVAVGLNFILFGIAAPLAGWLTDRGGPRRVMMVSLGLLAAGVAGTLLMREYWQLVLFWGVVAGIAGGGGAPNLGAAVANRWFVARRGLALGILNSAVSTGQLIFLPVLMALVVAAGWRTGTLLLLITALVCLLAVALWMRDDPEDIGLAAYGAAPSLAGGAAGAAAAPAIAPLGVVFRHPTFWLLAGNFFVCGASSNGLVQTHLVAHSIENGLSEVAAAGAVGIMGGVNFIGTLFSGWLTDRYDPRKVLAGVFVLRAISLFLLPIVTDVPTLMLFSIIFGLDWFASVAPVVTLSADAFGRQSVGTVFGWIFLSHQIGAALAAAFGGVMRDWLGDYQLAFLIGGVVALIGALFPLGITIRRGPAAAAAARGVSA